VARPGETIMLPVQVRRSEDLAGEIKLELLVPAHIHGVTADIAAIPAGQDRGMLTIHCADRLQGPFNMPLVVRGSTVGPAGLSFAEAKLDVQPE
jgi:hypothetical protein